MPPLDPQHRDPHSPEAASPAGTPTDPSSGRDERERLDGARESIRRAAQVYHQAHDALEDAREARDAALLEGHVAGLTKKELADLSGLTAPAVAKRLEARGVPVITHAERAEQRRQRRRERG